MNSPHSDIPQCPTCTTTLHTHPTTTPCPSCITFALLTQNSYATRWNTITSQPTPLLHTPLSPTPSSQQTLSPTDLQTPPRLRHNPSRPHAINLSPNIPPTTCLRPKLAISSRVTVATDIQLQQTNLPDIHTPHQTLPLTRTHLRRLAIYLHQPNMLPFTTATIFHYMTSLGHPTNCQPHHCLSLHINQITHAITPHTYDHHPALVTINLHLTSNNPYVIYTSTSTSPYALPPTTTLIHISLTNRQPNKRKRRPRAKYALPDATHIITFPPATSTIHKQTTLITAAHLILTAPHPKTIPWNILQHHDLTRHTVQRVLATLCMQTTYPLWIQHNTVPNTTATPPSHHTTASS